MAEPMAVIADTLVRQTTGQPYDEDAMEEACTLVAAANMVAAGMPLDVVENHFRDRDHSFRVAYDPGDDELTIEVIWDDEAGSDG